MRFVHLLIAGLFFLAAYWQLNDPDPELWVAAYGAVAVLAVYSAFKPTPRMIVLVLATVLGVWWATYLSDFISWVGDGFPTITGSMKAESPYVELVREFLGLTLTLGALGWYYSRSRVAVR